MSISMKRLSEILKSCKNSRIAVIGDLMLDVYLCGSASRLSQEAPVPILRVKDKSVRLGGAANVMRNLASLGAKKIYAFGVAGDDYNADTLRKLLSEGGIDNSFVVTDKTRRTTEKQRALAGAQQLVRMDFEDTHEVSPAIIARMTSDAKKLIKSGKIDAIIFEDYAKGLLTQDFMQEIADDARKHGIFTSLDPHPGHAVKVKKLSLMTPNRSEAFGLAGIYCHDAVNPVEKDEYLRKVAQKVMKDWDPESLLITLGAQGMALFERKSPKKMLAIPTKAREVFDVSGAGDTVIGTYTLCMAAGAASEEAAQISNHAAGVVVGKIGTATVSEEELIASFENDRNG